MRPRAGPPLAKADLVTGMVGEFPEPGHHGPILRPTRRRGGGADAIAPLRTGRSVGRVSDSPGRVAVALADKLDTLAGFLGIGQTPTGSRDPFALRRAALGVIRLAGETARGSLKDAFGAAYDLHCNPNRAAAAPGNRRSDADETINGLLSFFADRLQVHLRGEGVRHDLIAAVFGVDGGEDDLVRLRLRGRAIRLLVGRRRQLLAGYPRAANIVRIEEKKDGHRHDGSVDTALFNQNEESDSRMLGKVDDGLARACVRRFWGCDAGAGRTPWPDRCVLRAGDGQRGRRGDPGKQIEAARPIAATMNRVADFSRIEG